MRKVFLIVFVGISSILKAQDSTSIKVVESPAPKNFSHEIGFNATFLIKQLFSNNPSATLLQLPYQLSYTLGVKDKLGIRLGAGFEQSVLKTVIQGQTTPRTTKFISGSYRLDFCKNIMAYRKISSFAFVGGIFDQTKIETTTITDQTSFGGSLTKSELINSSVSFGAEFGLGLKYSYNKHIAIGIEIPVQVKYTSSKETDKQTVTNNFSTNSTITLTITNTTGMTTKVFLPTSLFIFIKF